MNSQTILIITDNKEETYQKIIENRKVKNKTGTAITTEKGSTIVIMDLKKANLLEKFDSDIIINETNHKKLTKKLGGFKTVSVNMTEEYDEPEKTK